MCSGTTGSELTRDIEGKKTRSFAGCPLAVAGSGTGPPMSCFSSVLENRVLTTKFTNYRLIKLTNLIRQNNNYQKWGNTKGVKITVPQVEKYAN